MVLLPNLWSRCFTSLYPLLFVKDYPILVFVLGVIITSALEYITSWVMEILFKTRWWDIRKDL